MPSRLSSAYIGAGAVAALAGYNTLAVVLAVLAAIFETLVFFNDGVG